MNIKNHYYKITVWIVFSFLFFSLLPGCAGKKSAEKDPFFDKWKAMAEKSQGYSPSQRKRTLDLPDKEKDADPGQGITVELEKTLPTEKITMKMHDIDVAVLLRTLARAADQNIMINEKVKGRADINIKEAPWDQVFRGILRTHGLNYAWEGEIIRIMTAEDMEQDLKREAQKKGFENCGASHNSDNPDRLCRGRQAQGQPGKISHFGQSGQTARIRYGG